jgi:hypothetical protein
LNVLRKILKDRFQDRRHDIRHNDTRHNDTQHIAKRLNRALQLVSHISMLSVIMISAFLLSALMLRIIQMSVTMLNVVLLSVAMLKVIQMSIRGAPGTCTIKLFMAVIVAVSS